MPSRWSWYDNDEESSSPGMSCIGYDAETKIYTFRHANGAIWESPPAHRYPLTLVSGPPAKNFDDIEDCYEPASPTHPTLLSSKRDTSEGLTWRSEMMPVLNFFMLGGIAMMLLVYTLGRPWSLGKLVSANESAISSKVCPHDLEKYQVSAGATCWKVAQQGGFELEDLLDTNLGLDCDTLMEGDVLCLPSEKQNAS